MTSLALGFSAFGGGACRCVTSRRYLKRSVFPARTNGDLFTSSPAAVVVAGAEGMRIKAVSYRLMLP